MAIGIEVERRALLKPQQRTELLAYMRSLGPVREVRRAMIDFSGEARQRTVTMRLNDNRLELVAKSGSLTDAVRRESNLQLDHDTTLDEALQYMSIMGYETASVSLRHMFIVANDEAEYSIRDVLSYDTGLTVDTLFDLEMLNVPAGAEQTALQQADALLAAHGLEPLTADVWQGWVKRTYASVDGQFAYSPESAGALAALLVKAGFYWATES